MHANSSTLLLALEEVSGQFQIGDLYSTFNEPLPLDIGRAIKSSNQFENHFIYDESGFISVPINSEVVGYPDHPRRSLNKSHALNFSEKFSAQVNISGFGSGVTLGPTLNFSRSYSVTTSISTSSVTSFLILNKKTGELNFDFSKKLRIACSVTATASTVLSASAGIKLFGVGADMSGGSANSATVVQESTPFHVPEINNLGRETSYKDATDWCETVFFKLNKESVDQELALISSQLTFKNEKNECDVDMDCMDWFEGLKDGARSSFSLVSREILSATPRCVSKENEKYPYNKCVVRKTTGQLCEPANAAWQIHSCDEGLHCSLSRRGGLFFHAIYRCE